MLATRQKDLSLLFLLFFLSFAYFFQSGQDNENARFDQIRSILEQQSLAIDDYRANTTDVIEYGGHIYPAKAPGLAVVAVPIWRMCEVILGLFDVVPEIELHLLCYLVTIFTVAFLSSLSCVVLFLLLRHLLPSDRIAIWITLAYGLGTIAFPFSTLFFSHQFSASLCFIAFGLVYFNNVNVVKNSAQVILAGLFCGIAVTAEYPSIFVGMALGVYILLRLGVRMFAFFALGASLAAAGLALYNLEAFGRVFYTPYSAFVNGAGINAIYKGHENGFLGIGIPRLSVLYEITFHPQRGLFYCNPWLILVIPALINAALVQKNRAENLLCSFLVVAYFCFNAGYAPGLTYSGGGASTGPRHVIPMLPFASILVAQLIQRRLFQWIFVPLAAVSAMIMVMASATDPRVAYVYQNPVTEFFFDHYRDSILATRREGPFSNRLLTEESVSFNLGKLARLPRTIQLVPLFGVWLVLGGILLRGRADPRVKAALGLTLLVFAAIPSVNAFQRERSRPSSGLFGRFYYGELWESCEETFEPYSDPTNPEERSGYTPTIDFAWGSHPPLPGSFSAEWEGVIHIPQSGIYQFSISSNGGSCIYLDNKLVFDNWIEQGVRYRDPRMYLSQGDYQFAIRYSNLVFLGELKLAWARDDGKFVTIPSNLFTPKHYDRSLR